MRHAPLVSLALAGALALPVAAHPQTPTQPDLPRGDVSVLTGWQGADRDDLEPQVYRSWYSAALGSAGVGVYWTEHLKTEVDISVSGPGEVFGSERVDIDRGVQRYIYKEHHLSTHTVSLTQSWQFLHNTWVHPFIGAGLDVDWQHRRTDVRAFVTTPTSPAGQNEVLAEERDRTRKARGVLTTGFKAYFTRRAFLRTDVRVSMGDGADTIRWRIGGGMDF